MEPYIEPETGKIKIELQSAWFYHKRWKGGDSIAGLQAAVKFHHLGYSSPQDLIEWVIKSFETYLGSNDTLDNCFNVSPSKKRKYRLNHRDSGFIIEIKGLVHAFDITVDDAIWAVSRRLEDEGEGISDTSLKDIYDRKGIKISDKKALDDIFSQMKSVYYTEQTLKHILTTYPKDVSEFLTRAAETTAKS